MSLGSSDSMEQSYQFMGDGILMEEGNLFDCVEDNGSFEDGSVE